MISNDLVSAWKQVELEVISKSQLSIRLVAPELLYRTYVGLIPMPARKFVIFEIPEKNATRYQAFDKNEGFEILIRSTGQEKEGFISCIIQARSSDQNDVFSIVCEDILSVLEPCKNDEDYITTLEGRLNKWKDFFKNKSSKILTETAQLGLFGELWLIDTLLNVGFINASEIWNGPIHSAQDFQWGSLAIEMKATKSNFIKSVPINSADQLSNKDYERLYLGVVRFSRADSDGMALHDLIETIERKLDSSAQKRFKAKLQCLGYDEALREEYVNRFKFEEARFYDVCNDFPRLVRSELPKGVSHIKYDINLDYCEDYQISIDDFLFSIKDIKQ